MRNNGHLLGSTGMSLGNARRFGEIDFRAVLSQVENFMRQAQGNAPVVDPVVVLALGIVLDKLNAIDERLAKLEEGSSVSKDVAEVLAP